MEAIHERNIKLIRQIQVLKAFMVAMPVIVIYWQGLGYSFADIFLLQAVFSTTVVIIEVPSGYFADRKTRRMSIIAGLWIASLGWGVYSLSSELWHFAVGEVFLGVSVAFLSGADKALLYDSLIALGLDPEDDFRAILYGNNARAFGGEAIAGLIGGGLAIVSLRYPIIAQLAVASLSIPLGYRLVEPELIRHQDTTNPIRAIGRVVRHALHENSGVKWLILLNAVLGTLTYTFVWFAQPYYKEAGVAIALFGLLSAAKHGSLMMVSKMANGLILRFGADRVLVSLPIVGVLTYLILSLGFSFWLLPVMIGFEYVRGVSQPLLESRIHNLIESDFRATVDSVNGLVARLSFTVFGIGIGVLGDAVGVLKTLMFSAALYGVLAAAVMVAMQNRGILNVKRR